MRYGLPEFLVWGGLLASSSAGCELGTVYVDPPVDIQRGGYLVEGDPLVELGQATEQIYLALRDGDAMPIVFGQQGGGRWLHLAIRTKGISPRGTLDCTVTLADGERVGVARSVVDFRFSQSGFLEKSPYTVLIRHTDAAKGPDIDDLYGADAIVKCSVTDEEERRGEASVNVVLEKG